MRYEIASTSGEYLNIETPEGQQLTELVWENKNGQVTARFTTNQPEMREP